MNLNLKQLRKKHGLTQNAVAQKTGVTLRAYIRWESGDRAPDFYSLQALERVLGKGVSKAIVETQARKKESP